MMQRKGQNHPIIMPYLPKEHLSCDIWKNQPVTVRQNCDQPWNWPPWAMFQSWSHGPIMVQLSRSHAQVICEAYVRIHQKKKNKKTVLSLADDE